MRWLALWGTLSMAGCVTESLSVCINCNNFTVSRLRGGFTVVLTASVGQASPCEVLQAQMTAPIAWQGCFDPRGGTADSVRGVIRFDFVDSTGAKGAIEFLDVEGDPDSARSTWRTNCLKTAPAGDCPVGSGLARWFRTPATP